MRHKEPITATEVREAEAAYVRAWAERQRDDPELLAALDRLQEALERVLKGQGT